MNKKVLTLVVVLISLALILKFIYLHLPPSEQEPILVGGGSYLQNIYGKRINVGVFPGPQGFDLLNYCLGNICFVLQ